MLVAVRAEVEDVERWREGFKTHSDLFVMQKISIAHLGATTNKLANERNPCITYWNKYFC